MEEQISRISAERVLKYFDAPLEMLLEGLLMMVDSVHLYPLAEQLGEIYHVLYPIFHILVAGELDVQPDCKQLQHLLRYHYRCGGGGNPT